MVARSRANISCSKRSWHSCLVTSWHTTTCATPAAPEGNRPHGSFGGVVVQLQHAVFEIRPQPLDAGVPRDIVLAHMWSSLAAAQGHKSAQENRDNAAELMTPNQIAEARRLAREWMAKHQQ
jgi:hypothetical protein